MKNWLKYYYDIDVESVRQYKNEYKFNKDGKNYCLISTNRSKEEVIELYDLTHQLHKLGIPCHQMVPNQSNEIITYINNKPYILIIKYVNSNDPITINDIIKFSDVTTFDWNYHKLNRTDWKSLWIQKIDYFEYQLSQIGRRHPRIVPSFSYYEGITENAIQLINIYSKITNASVCVAHKRISYDTTLDDFYNPFNFIIDYKVRDMAEYLKQKNNFLEVDRDLIIYLFSKFILKNDDKVLFMIRTLFPSFYFDLYEKVLDGTVNEEALLSIMGNTKVYENLIKKIYTIISIYIKIPAIDWLSSN